MSEITFIAGGATAAQGFSATGEHMGIRRNRTRRDVALIVSEVPANAACVYTQNLVKGAPILVTQKHVENGVAQAVICNSGNANTCNANGIEIAEGMCSLVEQYIGVKAEDVIVASTGVIGQPMTLEPFQKKLRQAGRFAGGHPRRRHPRGRGHHDHRHGLQGGRRALPPGRQNVQAGRHRQGQRHDRAQHGHHGCAS